MSEVKTKLIRLQGDSYIITESHTTADILRWLRDEVGDNEINMVLKELRNAKDGS